MRIRIKIVVFSLAVSVICDNVHSSADGMVPGRHPNQKEIIMANSFNTRPTQIEIGSSVYIVRHTGAGRTAISEVVLESRTSDAPVAKLTSDDVYIFRDGEDQIEVVLATEAKAPHLILKNTKTRVSFWTITPESTEMKEASDLQNSLRQRADDARAAERRMREDAAAVRAQERAARGSTTKVSKRESIEARIESLTRRQSTQMADLEKTQKNLKEAIDTLAELDAAEAAKSTEQSSQTSVSE